MQFVKRIRPLWVIFALLALTAIAWAVAELSGQANKAAADAGASSADLEMASLESIKPSQKAPNCDWTLEKKLRGNLEKQDKAYKPLLDKAQKEANNDGKVSKGSGDALLKAAGEFKVTSDEYAAMWGACDCRSRANLAKEAGATRVASAQLVVSGADGKKSDALKSQQAKMNEARKTYVKEAADNKELSDADKAAIKTNLMPRAKKMVNTSANLALETGKLLDRIKNEASSATKGGIGGLAGKALSGATGGGSPASLISPVTNLLSLTQTLATNAKALVDDLTMLSK